MQQILQILLAFLNFFVGINFTNAAATSTGRLLKYYPINPQEYATLFKLINHQPVISENRLVDAGQRSMADGSSSLPNGWESIFNLDRPIPETEKKGVTGYPLCVLTANVSIRRRKRNDEMSESTHAGVSPTTVYTTPSYPEYVYEQPSYETPMHGSPHYGPPEYGPPESGGLPHYNPYPHNPPHHGPGGNNHNEKPNALVNCVVVLRKNKKPSTTTPKPEVYHPEPYDPYSNAIPPWFLRYPPIPFDYYSYANPFHSTFSMTPEPSSRKVDATSRRNANIKLNSVPEYNQMLTEYYKQLTKSHVVNTPIQVAKGLLGSDVDEIRMSPVQYSPDHKEQMNYDDDDYED